MFVEIDNIDMDALKVEEWINNTRDANGGVISPEFAMEILGKTNHFAHIKKVLKHITKERSDENGKLVADKVLEYKEFILSAVDRREVSPQTMKVLQDLAEKGNIKNEFEKTNSKTKIYEIKDCENVDVKIVKSRDEFYALKGEGLKVFFDADNVNLEWCNFGKVQKIKFKEEAEADLSGAYFWPKDLDVSVCSKVNFCSCNLEGLELNFREGAVVKLYGAHNLPKNLDFSMCSKVNLASCDLTGVEKIKFKDKEQQEKFMYKVKNFGGEIEYEGDVKKGKNMANGHGGMEM